MSELDTFCVRILWFPTDSCLVTSETRTDWHVDVLPMPTNSGNLTVKKFITVTPSFHRLLRGSPLGCPNTQEPRGLLQRRMWKLGVTRINFLWSNFPNFWVGPHICTVTYCCPFFMKIDCVCVCVCVCAPTHFGKSYQNEISLIFVLWFSSCYVRTDKPAAKLILISVTCCDVRSGKRIEV
jgi:hypothetical protein